MQNDDRDDAGRYRYANDSDQNRLSPDEFVRKYAPRELPKWFARIYGILIAVFSLALLISWWSNDELDRTIFLVVFLFGLSIAFWAFYRLTESRSGALHYLGILLAFLLLLSISFFFIAVMANLLFESAFPGLDPLLGKEAEVIDLEKPMAYVSHVTTGSVAISIAPKATRDIAILAELYEPSSPENVEVKTVSDVAEEIVFEGLNEATPYRVALTARQNTSESAPTILRFATRADLHPVSPSPLALDPLALYTGDVTPDGEFSSSSAEIEFEGTYYRGEVERGQPHGQGVFGFRQNCFGEDGAFQCTYGCINAQFNSGRLTSASCRLPVEAPIPIILSDGGRSYLPDGIDGFYDGEVIGYDHMVLPKSHDMRKYSAEAGIFNVLFHGQGRLETSDGDVWEGTWDNGTHAIP